MANELYADYRERGFEYIHVLIDGPTGGLPTAEDAHTWAYEMDFDYDGTVDPLDIMVIADVDGLLWGLYSECPLTPQDQIHDQGLVNVDDACTLGNLCGSCGYSDSHVRTVLEGILPTRRCGQTTQ